MKRNPQNSQLLALSTAVSEDFSVIQKTLWAGRLTFSRWKFSTYLPKSGVIGRIFPNILPLYVGILILSSKSALKGNYCYGVLYRSPLDRTTNHPHFTPDQMPEPSNRGADRIKRINCPMSCRTGCKCPTGQVIIIKLNPTVMA